jgi:hypothetical protein
MKRTHVEIVVEEKSQKEKVPTAFELVKKKESKEPKKQ